MLTYLFTGTFRGEAPTRPRPLCDSEPLGRSWGFRQVLVTMAGRTQMSTQNRHGKLFFPESSLCVCMSQEFTTRTLTPTLEDRNCHFLFTNEETEATGD